MNERKAASEIGLRDVWQRRAKGRKHASCSDAGTDYDWSARSVRGATGGTSKMKLFAFAVRRRSVAPAAGATSDAAQRFGAREDVAADQPVARRQDASPSSRRHRGAASAVYVVAIDGSTPKPIMASSRRSRTSCSSCRLVDQRPAGVQHLHDRAGRQRHPGLYAARRDRRRRQEHEAAERPHESSRALGVAQNGGKVIDWLGDDAGGAVLMTRVYIPESNHRHASGEFTRRVRRRPRRDAAR